MKRVIVLMAVPLFCLLMTGCGKKYASNCKKAVELTEPWAGLSLPVSNGRVCESSRKDAKIQYVSKDTSKWRDAYDQAFQDAGYEKQDCKSGYCIYTKGKASRVQVIVSSISRWVNVTIHENR
jgi:hypothetical protein